MSHNRAQKILAALAPAIIALLPTAVFAHPGHLPAEGTPFVDGLLHPLSGADHLSALFLAGGWTAMQRGNQVRLPVALLAAMAAGFVAGPTVGAALAEALIAISVVGLAAAIALHLRPPAAFAMPAFALFGFGHGLAHGIEGASGSIGFMIGMLATSALLMILGFTAGTKLIRRHRGPSTRD